MASDYGSDIAHMDTNFHQSLSKVQALVAISVAVGLLKACLRHNSHDARIFIYDFLDVVEITVSLDV